MEIIIGDIKIDTDSDKAELIWEKDDDKGKCVEVMFYFPATADYHEVYLLGRHIPSSEVNFCFHNEITLMNKDAAARYMEEH